MSTNTTRQTHRAGSLIYVKVKILRFSNFFNWNCTTFPSANRDLFNNLTSFVQVELHMRYIQLQRILQNKMHELDKLCIRERQLIEGKWKTHSLPARKKTSSHANYGGDPTTPTQAPYSYCRPTVSTEDVAKAQQKQHAPPTLILAYQCLDPRYHYTLQSSKTNSGEYLLTFEQPRYKRDDHHFIAKTPCNAPQKQNKANQTNGSARKNKKNQEGCHSYGGHLCSPCIQASNSADNSSLEAYDLASPCCDPHCVPTVRRRSRNSHNKESKKRDSKTEETQTDSRAPHRERPPPHQSSQTQSAPRRYFQFGAGLVSQCSLHSCTSSELSVIAPTTTGESTGSYTTSLSTDTLYWDGLCDGITKQMSMKSSGKHESQYKHNQQPPQTHHDPIHVQYTTVKPKSWDNLATTKSYGGYGFGYGYIDTSTKYLAGKGRTQSTKTHSNNPQYVRIPNSCSGPTQYTPHAQRGHFHPTKSTESLLSVPKYSIEALSDSSTSCECLETVSPAPDTSDRKFFQSPRQSVVCSTDPNLGYYSTRSSRNEYPKAVVTTSSEATQL